MQYLKVAMVLVATWRFYRLVAVDTGPKCLLRKFRCWVGVRYNGDWSEWSTENGSLAEMITCCKCAPVWWGAAFTLLYLFASDTLFFLITLPLIASAFTLVFENIVYAPREK